MRLITLIINLLEQTSVSTITPSQSKNTAITGLALSEEPDDRIEALQTYKDIGISLTDIYLALLISVI